MKSAGGAIVFNLCLIPLDFNLMMLGFRQQRQVVKLLLRIGNDSFKQVDEASGVDAR